MNITICSLTCYNIDFNNRTMQQPLTWFERLPVISRDQLPIKRKINDIFELIGEEFRCSPNRNLIVHVYQGANEAGHQWYPFHRATNILNMEKASIFYCNIKMVKDNWWNPKDLVDWLLNSDVHFIITHNHQGLEQLSWDMVELYNEVQGLRYHLRCPIWTQDKFDYLSAIASDGLCNPTYKVDLNIESLMDFEKIRDDIVWLLKYKDSVLYTALKDRIRNNI